MGVFELTVVEWRPLFRAITPHLHRFLCIFSLFDLEIGTLGHRQGYHRMRRVELPLGQYFHI